MVATKLRGKITKEGRLEVDVPAEIEPGAVEVILLHDTPAKLPRQGARKKATHPAFGIWADLPDGVDSAEIAAQLRKKVETRNDRRE